MKIIQDGNPDKLKEIVRFTCKKCDCIFEAEKGEYKTDSQYNETYYICECPFCHNSCSSNKQVQDSCSSYYSNYRQV